MFYWFNPKKGGVYPKEESMVYGFNHISFVSNYPELFEMTSLEVEEIFNSYDEPVGTEGTARLDMIEKILSKGWLRARYWMRGQSSTWYIEVKNKNFQKDLIRSFASEVAEKLNKRDQIVLIDTSGESYYSAKEFFQILESKENQK